MIDVIEDKIEEINRERLEKIGVELKKCRGCGRDILFLKTNKGKYAPVNLSLRSHFSDCPAAYQFRAKRRNEIQKEKYNPGNQGERESQPMLDTGGED